MSGANRIKKLAGRVKRQQYAQGTRAYLHAVVNSKAKRLNRRKRKRKGS